MISTQQRILQELETTYGLDYVAALKLVLVAPIIVAGVQTPISYLPTLTDKRKGTVVYFVDNSPLVTYVLTADDPTVYANWKPLSDASTLAAVTSTLINSSSVAGSVQLVANLPGSVTLGTLYAVRTDESVTGATGTAAAIIPGSGNNGLTYWLGVTGGWQRVTRPLNPTNVPSQYLAGSRLPNLRKVMERGLTPRIFFLGDSTFAGSGLTAPDYITTYFKSVMEAAPTQFGTTVTVTNIAQGGNTTREMTGRVQAEVLNVGSRPHMVVWAPVINDVVRRNQGTTVPTLPAGPITPQQCRDELVAVGTKIMTEGIDLILVDPPENPTAMILSGPLSGQTYESDYSRAMRGAVREAASMLGCGFFSRSQCLKDAVATSLYTWTSLFQSDGLHPSAQQNLLLATTLANSIKSPILPEGRPFSRYISLISSRFSQYSASAGLVSKAVDLTNHKTFGGGEVVTFTMNNLAATITLKHIFWGSDLALVFDQLGVLTGSTTATVSVDGGAAVAWDIPWQSSSGAGFFQQLYPVVDGLSDDWHSIVIVISSGTISTFASLTVSGWMEYARRPFPELLIDPSPSNLIADGGRYTASNVKTHSFGVAYGSTFFLTNPNLVASVSGGKFVSGTGGSNANVTAFINKQKLFNSDRNVLNASEFYLYQWTSSAPNQSCRNTAAFFTIGGYDNYVTYAEWVMVDTASPGGATLVFSQLFNPRVDGDPKHPAISGQTVTITPAMGVVHVTGQVWCNGGYSGQIPITNVPTTGTIVLFGMPVVLNGRSVIPPHIGPILANAGLP